MSHNNSKIKNIFLSIVSFVLGIVIGAIANIYLSLPESNFIPEKTKLSSHYEFSAGEIDADVINESELSMHFLELGNKYTGDCIYIKVGETDILVDGGSKTSSISTIKDYVDAQCTDKTLDFVIVTHAHEDHYACYATGTNTESLFDHYTSDGFSIGTIIDFAQTKKTLSNKMYANYIRERDEAVENGAKHFTAKECYDSNGTTNEFGVKMRNYELGNGVILQILHTMFYEDENVAISKTENDFSVCFQLISGDKKYLFTGDLEGGEDRTSKGGDGEKSLVDDNIEELGPVELYKAGHHGSKTSSSEYLLGVIQPKIVVCCCCAGSSEYTSNNENQFPTQKFVNRVAKYTENIYVTTLCKDYKNNIFESFNGTVVVCSVVDLDNNKNTVVMCSNNSTILKESDWFKNNRSWSDEESA